MRSLINIVASFKTSATSTLCLRFRGSSSGHNTTTPPALSTAALRTPLPPPNAPITSADTTSNQYVSSRRALIPAWSILAVLGGSGFQLAGGVVAAAGCNLHWTGPAAVSATLAVERARQPVTVRREWAPGSDLSDGADFRLTVTASPITSLSATAVPGCVVGCERVGLERRPFVLALCSHYLFRAVLRASGRGPCQGQGDGARQERAPAALDAARGAAIACDWAASIFTVGGMAPTVPHEHHRHG